MKSIILCLTFLSLAEGAIVDPQIALALKTSQEVEIVGTFKETATNLSIPQLKEATKKKVKSLKNISVSPLWITHGFSAKVSKNKLAELLKNPEIQNIFLNKKFKFEGENSNTSTDSEKKYFVENLN